MLRRLSALAILAVCASACAAPPVPFSLRFTVFPTTQGADVIVEVHGGRNDVAWVGFAAGPGAPADLPQRVHSVQASTLDGRRLPQQLHGRAGYEIELEDSSWQLAYSLDLRPRPGDDIFYRSSVKEDDYLVLVGSDAWARFYTRPDALAMSTTERPGGAVLEAQAAFNLPEQPTPWKVATTARARSARTFELSEHPTASVFALGPFEIRDIDEVPGLQLAVHPTLERAQRIDRRPHRQAAAVAPRGAGTVREHHRPGADEPAAATARAHRRTTDRRHGTWSVPDPVCQR